MEDVRLRITLKVRARDHEADVVACKDGRCLNGVGVVDGEGTTTTCDVYILRAVDGEGFLPKVVELPGIAGDVPDVLKFFGDGVVDYETVENI